MQLKHTQRQRYTHELALMCACRASIRHGEGFIGQDEIERVPIVREGRASHLHARSIPGTAASLKTRKVDMVNEILSDEFVDQFRPAAVPNLVGDAPHQRPRVFGRSHRLVLSPDGQH